MKYETYTLEGYIYLKTGLRVGGNKDTMQIGGIDSPVIKNTLTNMPYIPGSSIKGKTRFLLEAYYGLENKKRRGAVPSINDLPNSERASGWKANKIAQYYGHTDHDKDAPSYPTRVIFRDCDVAGAIMPGNEISVANIERNLDYLRDIMGADFTEGKMEVAIDRLSGTVSGSSGPRTLERVPAGVVFDFSLTFRTFEDDEAQDILDIVQTGLKLLQQDALGGSGSRGYGRIVFFGMKLNGKDIELA